MAAEPKPWWQRLTTVRARTTIAATVVLGVALVIAAVALVVLVRRSLVGNLDELADVRAQDVAALAAAGPLPRSLGGVGEDGARVQVVDADGDVVANTTGLPRDEPISDIQPRANGESIAELEGVPGDDDDVRLLVLGARGEQGPLTIYVVNNLEPVNETIAILSAALVAGAPLLLAFVAVTTWVVVGRAFRPVADITDEVADISGHSLDRRVPVPPTDDEISHLAETMNTMLDRLEGSAKRQQRFVADASHELQTPLASVRADLEVAQAHPADTDWGRMVSDVLEANARMEHLVRDLLFLARTDDSAVDSRPRVPVDLDDVVLGEASRIRQSARVRVDTSKVSAAAVEGRREDLRRAIGNVLENAERYAAGTVSLELASDDHQATLVIHDDGPGVVAADRERLFERFTRLDDARSRDTGGAGLGLAIAREIIEAHDGSIVLADSDRGARFVIRLPAG